MKHVSITILAMVLVFGMTDHVSAYSSNPPQGYAGDPPANNTCRNCHSSYGLNSGDGTLNLSGITSYEPGQAYNLTVHLDDPSQSRWGFQLIAKDNTNNFVQGVFTITDPINTQQNVNYINHTSAGTFTGAQEANWNVTWNAPFADVGPITFYFTGVAANNGSGSNGDYVYSEMLTVEADVPPYEFTVLPSDDFIPAGGGSIDYTVTLTTSIPQSYTGVTYWSTVVLPNGNEMGPILQINNLTVPPNANISATFTLDVPGYAPPGGYLHHSKLGYFPNAVAVATWNFFKGSVPDGSVGPSEWGDHGGFAELTSMETNTANSVDTYKIASIYPNPFNAMTVVSVMLPETADLSVTVYNVLGKAVATLADGPFAPGTQAFTFDAAGLSSGLYFIRAVVPGQMNQTQKVMLVQ